MFNKSFLKIVNLFMQFTGIHFKKMSTVQYNKTVLVSLALVMVAVILPVEAIRTWDDWNNGQDGIKWLYNCEFPGSWTLEAKEYNNDYMPMEESQCGRACIDRRGCNSFVYREGTCFLKSSMIPGSAKPFRLCNQCDSCGFLPWKFHWFIYLWNYDFIILKKKKKKFPSCMI